MRIMKDDNCHEVKDRIIHTECLIIDEVSMLSCRTFTRIENLCRIVRGKDQLFGGIQVILSGDLYQLKPVPNAEYGDFSQHHIEQPEFNNIIPHKFVLITVQRQIEGTFISHFIVSVCFVEFCLI